MKIGALDFSGGRVGSTVVSKIYLGAGEVWPLAAAGPTIVTVTVDPLTAGDLPLTVSTLETPDGTSPAYFVLVPQGSGEPSIAQIKAGQQSSGAAASDAWTTTWLAIPPKHTIVTGLDGFFDLYAVINNGADSNVGAALNFEVDTVNPALTLVIGTQTGTTTADWSATSDEADGTIFAAVRLDTDPVLTEAEIEGGTGNAIAISSDATPTADANNGGSFTGLSQLTDYRVDAFQEDEFGNRTGVATSAQFTTASGSFVRASIGLAGSTNRLERVASFANTTNATTQMQFASITMPPAWTSTVRPLKIGNGESGLRINTDGSIRSRIYAPANVLLGSIANTGATALASDDELNIMALWDTTGASDSELWYQINAGAWVLGFTQNITGGALIDNTLANGSAEIPKNGSQDFGAVHRLAVWMNGEALVDFSVSANRDKFVDAGGLVVDPATSRTDYGIPAIDLYEAAATWNAATGNNSGNGGDFTTDGGFTNA